MKVPPARNGTKVEIRGRDLAFTRWAMRRTTGRSGLNTRLFATDPWPVVRRAVRDSKKAPKTAKDAAVAFLGQAKAYYHGATDAALAEAKPVLLYYCFLNLAKALILSRGERTTFNRTRHGLSERLHPNGKELVGAFLEAHPAGRYDNIFDIFWRALGGPGISATTNFDLVTLLPQVVPGHRLWAAGASKGERFVALDELQLLEDKTAKTVWVKLQLQAGDLTRLGVARKNVLRDSGLSGAWRDVRCPSGLVWFEPNAPTSYGSFATDKVMDAIDVVAPHLWTTVLDNPPYRKYYLYMCPPAELSSRMPQLCSLYAIAYYLGSITRYRPHHFTSILDGPYGPFVEAFLNDQPTQFLYLIASEFAQREVTRAALA